MEKNKGSLNIQSRREPIKALHFFEKQPLFLSPFPLLLISADNSGNANSLGSSRIISLQTAAEKIEIISLLLIEPMIVTANNTSPASAMGRCQVPALGGCLMFWRTERMRAGNLIWAEFYGLHILHT